MQGRGEMNGIQAAHCDWPYGPGQNPDARAQIDQVDLIQHGRQTGDRLCRIGASARNDSISVSTELIHPVSAR